MLVRPTDADATRPLHRRHRHDRAAPGCTLTQARPVCIATLAGPAQRATAVRPAELLCGQVWNLHDTQQCWLHHTVRSPSTQTGSVSSRASTSMRCVMSSYATHLWHVHGAALHSALQSSEACSPPSHLSWGESMPVNAAGKGGRIRRTCRRASQRPAAAASRRA